jgi:CRISPR/Cas system-associated exonuclease Cas4 (RecB family)
MAEFDDNRTEDGLFKVSQSKVKQYRECRRKWWYAHVVKLARKKPVRPLAFGSIVHKMKETLAEGGDPLSVLDELPRQDIEAYQDDPEQFGDIIGDIRYIFKAYAAYWQGRELKYLPHGKRRAEHPFEIEIPKEKILIKGTIDAVTSHRGFNWLTEHKNHKSIPNDDERWRSVQSVVYIKVIEMLDWWKNIEGTCWDYIRTKSPTRPELLKSGEISKRKIDTLPAVIIDTLGQDLKRHRSKSEQDVKFKKDFNSLIDAAILNMPTYFQRVYTPIKRRLVNKVWEDFLTTSKEMRDAKMRQPPMSIGRHCSWCAFESICRAELTDGDVDFVIEHEYVPNTYGESSEETID